MGTRPWSADECVAALRETPTLLASAARAAKSDHLERRPSPDQWSAREVLVHLRACADIWGQAIARLLDEDHPTIEAVNPRRWQRTMPYGATPFDQSLRAFARQRRQLLRRLEPLDEDEWGRWATVTGGGRPRRVTVGDYAYRLARHERPHVRQLRAVLARVKGGGG